MNRSILNGMTAACLLALPVAPALAAPPAHDVQAGRYRVEPEHTEIIFSMLHLGFTPYSGMFSGVSGTLQLDPAHHRPHPGCMSACRSAASIRPATG